MVDSDANRIKSTERRGFIVFSLCVIANYNTISQVKGVLGRFRFKPSSILLKIRDFRQSFLECFWGKDLASACGGRRGVCLRPAAGHLVPLSTANILLDDSR